MVQLTDRTPPASAGAARDADRSAVKLFSAANETVSFQLIVDAGEAGLRDVKLSVDPLTGSGKQHIPPEGVGLFRMLPVAVQRYPSWYLRLTEAAVTPASFYDVLVPIDLSWRGERLDLAGGERLAVWVDVRVPRAAPAGEYAGAVRVRYRGGAAAVNVSLRVYDIVLPDARPVACVGGFAHETIFRQFIRRRRPDGTDEPYVPQRLDTARKEVRAGLVILRELMRLGHDHGLDLFDKTIHPVLRRDAFGAVVLRWDDYDNIVKPYLDGTAFENRIGVAAWPAPARLDAPVRAAPGRARAPWPVPEHYGGADTSAYRDTVAAVLAEVVDHFEALGMSGKLFFWPRPGRVDQAAYRRHAALARLARSAAPDLPILTTLAPAPPAEANLSVPEDFSVLADMFAPPADMFAPADVTGLARGRGPLAGLWLRPGRPPYLGGCGVLAVPADVRALPWLAMKYQCAGIFLPEVLNWPTEATTAAGGQQRLFHPGANGALLPSVRLKRLRRGLEDAGYLWLLRQHQRPAVADAILNTMVHYAALDAAGDHYLDPRLDGWVRRGDLWTAARRLLAEEVASAVHPQDVSNRQLLALQVLREQLRRRACRVRVERICSRFAPAADGLFRATLAVELYNELPRAAEVVLRMGALPTGWRALQGSYRAVIPAGEQAVVELSAEGDHVPAEADAKMKIPVSMTSELQDRTEVVGWVPLLLLGYANRPIAIDGDLADWPLRPGNTAANFRLLGKRGAVGDGLAKRQTAVFAVRDDENLYLAFRCDEPDPEKIHARPSNIVRYEQLLARGEDLVEVVLDPGRAAKSAADLYHLVIKCNGAIVAERGIHADPPLGLAGPWPATAKVYVAKREKLWIVELAIPLKALGPGASARLWGVNFTRFATAGDEPSSWAGAVRHFYDPRNLGTMYLAPKGRRPPLVTTRPAP